VIVPKGEAANPMSEAEIEQKFLSLSSPIIGHERSRKIICDIEGWREESIIRLIGSLRL
jgi:hypothetical protein